MQSVLKVKRSDQRSDENPRQHIFILYDYFSEIFIWYSFIHIYKIIQYYYQQTIYHIYVHSFQWYHIVFEESLMLKKEIKEYCLKGQILCKYWPSYNVSKIEGLERKRSKCFFTYLHLNLFRSHPLKCTLFLTFSSFYILMSYFTNFRMPGHVDYLPLSGLQTWCSNCPSLCARSYCRI